MRTRTLTILTVALMAIGFGLVAAGLAAAQEPFDLVPIPEEVEAVVEGGAGEVVTIDPQTGEEYGAAVGEAISIARGVSTGAPWHVTAALVMWFMVKLLRGRMGFRVPLVSGWLGALNKRGLTISVIVAGALAGGLGNLAGCGATLGCFVSGLVAGLSTSIGAMGVSAAYDHGVRGKK